MNKSKYIKEIIAEIESKLKWNTLKIIIYRHKALFINGPDTIFSTKYNQLIGKIKGIRLVTKGSGAFDFVRFWDSEGMLKFSDDFEN